MKPCPFCGGESCLQTNNLMMLGWEVRTHCASCGADGPNFRYTHQRDRETAVLFAELAWDVREGEK